MNEEQIDVSPDSDWKIDTYREHVNENVCDTGNSHAVPCNTSTDTEGSRPGNKKSNQWMCIIGCRQWLVLLTGFMSCFMSNGFIFHMSVLFLELQDTFQKSKAETAVVQSVASGTFLCGGVFSGLIITKLGVVRAGLVGVSLSVIGLAGSFFAPNIPYLVVFLGLMTGFGSSLIYLFGTSVVGLFFKGKEKLLALSISSVGAGVGSLTFPYLIHFLSMEYGFRGALLILSGVMSHEFLVVLFTSNMISNFSTATNKCNSEKSIKTPRQVSEICMRIWKSESTIKLMRTLKHEIFMLYMIALSLSLGIFSGVAIVLVDIYESEGFDRHTALLLYLIMNLTGLFARILPGLLKKIPHVSIFDVLILGEVFSAAGFGLFPTASSFSMKVCVAAMLGVFLGISTSLASVGSMAILGAELFPIGQGVNLTTMGIFTLVGGPLKGLVKDLTGSYDAVIYTMCAISSVTLVVLTTIRIRRAKNKATKTLSVLEEGGKKTDECKNDYVLESKERDDTEHNTHDA